MDSLYREAVQKKVEKKFKGKEALQAKQKPNKPVSAEREYIRLAKEVDEAVLDALKDALPKIKKSATEGMKLTVGTIHKAKNPT